MSEVFKMMFTEAHTLEQRNLKTYPSEFRQFLESSIFLDFAFFNRV